MSSGIIRSIGVVSVLVGLLAWSGVADAVKPNPPGKQAGKFVVLGTGDVLDTTTSLRWQQTPGAPGDTVSNCDNGNRCVWQDAVDYCAALGGGSRLAEVKELSGLVDYSQFNLALPPGHPFNGVRSARYWSATTPPNIPQAAWAPGFFNGDVTVFDKDFIFHAWCVR